MEVETQTYCRWFVSTNVREANNGVWVFMGFYGYPDTIKRRFS